MDFLLNNEPLIRISCFGGILLLMLLLEHVIPYRPNSSPKGIRWPANLGLIALDTLAVRLLIPIMPAALALYMNESQWGLFHVLDLPFVLRFILTILLLDLLIYGQHVVFHKVPLLWRLHKVHHTDTDIDTTTGIRFHPIEILLSIIIKLGAVALLGASAIGVIAFEILLNATSLFNHGNIKLPKFLDKSLRLLIVTPDMHRVHHSVIPQETDSNFGFNLSIWDKIFKTYKAQPQKGHLNMTIGLKQYQDYKKLSLINLLKLPFQK